MGRRRRWGWGIWHILCKKNSNFSLTARGFKPEQGDEPPGPLTLTTDDKERFNGCHVNVVS